MSPLPATLAGSLAVVATWVDDVDALLGRPGLDPSYAALRAVLHVLRREFDAESAAALSAALPTVLRGVFHQPLTTTTAPPLAYVASATRHAVRPEEAVRAVCAVLDRQCPEVWAGIRPALPVPLSALVAIPPHPYRPARSPSPCPSPTPTTSGPPRPVASAAARSARSTRRRPAFS